MEPLDFLRLVLPSPGHGVYCACELSHKKEHVYEDAVDALLPHVERWVAKKADIYFALAAFEEKGNRLASNARWMKSMFVDMDGYESPKHALAALDQFLNKTALCDMGQPYVVVSGGGLHVYWPLTQEIDIDTWKPIAENFKRLCNQEGLKIDNTVTADAARVLRVPGTKNFKSKYPKPRNVRLLTEGEVFSHELLAATILGKLTIPSYEHATAKVIDLPGQRPAAAGESTVQLFKNNVTKFKLIMAATASGEGCGQLAHYIENAADEGMEPLWRGWLSIAQKCEDGEKAAEKLTRLHPYTPERLRQKWAEIKGPYPCRKFDSENPGLCPGCKHWGKITNPLALGQDLDTVAQEIEVEVITEPVNDVEPVKTTYRIPEPPYGYEYGKNGGVIRVEEKEDGPTKKTQILSYTLYVLEMLHTAEGHFIHIVAMRKDGPRLFSIPAESIATRDATIKALAKESVMADFGGHDKELYCYLRACVGMVASEGAAKVPHHFGWQEDGTIALAGLIFRKHNEPLKVPMPSLQNIVAATQPKGNIDAWRSYMQMVIAKGTMTKHLAVFLIGTAAPLMRYTDFAGITVHCCSKDSSTGKTLSLNMVSSVWGNPKDYKVGKGTSPVAMQHHLGLLNSFPLPVDEITENTRKDPEWFANWLLAITDGKGKERMESGTNRERLNLTTWASVAVMSSNTHAMDFLTAGRKHSAEGELYRLLEFKMNDVLHWTPSERAFIAILSNNYGVAGYRLAQWLVDHEEELQQRVRDATEWARKEFDMSDEERYWLAGLGAACAMAKILKEAGIIALPLKAILAVLKDTLETMRAEITGNKRTTDDILWEYIQSNYGQMIIIRRPDEVPKMSDFRLQKEQDLSTARSTIMGRVDVNASPGWTDFYIPNALLRKHCADRNFAFQDFIAQVTKSTSVIAVPNRKVDMLHGTRMGGSELGRVMALKVSCRNEQLQVDVGASAVPMEKA